MNQQQRYGPKREQRECDNGDNAGAGFRNVADVDAEPECRPEPHGVVRVGGKRVTLDRVGGAFRAGATAEEIAARP